MMNSASYLRLADHAHAWTSAASRAALQQTANTFRLFKGQGPVPTPTRGATPHETVAEREGIKLLRYPARDGKAKASVVVVASLINQYYVMDLLPEVSVIDTLARKGMDVYVLDWAAPGAEGPQRDFSDYADGFIPWAVEHASKGGKPPHVLGYCMGGTLAVIHAARHPEQVRSLTLLGAPVDFHKSGVLATWTDRRYFDADLMVDAFGNVPPFMLQSAFKTMATAGMVKKYSDLWERADDEGAVRHFLAVESWLEDNIAFPGGLYRPYIRDCYQDNKLIKSEMVVAGKKVELKKITMPLLTVVATKDNICAPAASLALQEVAGSTDKQAIEFETGHIGLTTSKRALKEMWPRVATWMLER
ncbi:MAG: alpha/beta fold hydrolase [Myxococcota bacterium]